MRGKTGGFTLIELMIVVAIVGILAVIATEKMSTTIRHTKEATTKGNLAILRVAIGTLYAENDGVYPTTDPTAQLIAAGLLTHIPTRFVEPYHPDGNDISFGNWTTMITAHGAWMYISDQTDPSWGTIVVNCVHEDLKGNEWSSY